LNLCPNKRAQLGRYQNCDYQAQELQKQGPNPVFKTSGKPPRAPKSDFRPALEKSMPFFYLIKLMLLQQKSSLPPHVDQWAINKARKVHAKLEATGKADAVFCAHINKHGLFCVCYCTQANCIWPLCLVQTPEYDTCAVVRAPRRKLRALRPTRTSWTS
jgi:hypothetical protein